MPANNPRTAAPMPASPRSTAKYTNKDGSKFITVPKGTPSDSSRPSTPTANKNSNSPPPTAPAMDDPAARPVNRKKQKRRQKAAAKAAAEHAANGRSGVGSAAAHSRSTASQDQDEVASDDEHEYVLAEESSAAPINGHMDLESKSKRTRKKKKKKGVSEEFAEDELLPPPSDPHHPHHLHHHHHHHHHHAHPPPPGPGISRDKIWSTSNHEERERIKEFWLGLGEDERKSLVKVEKDAVLKKMKEQQKHTCSCTVCGRKRTAIEEELEGLYDAYYLELEQFANQGEGPPMLPPPRDFPIRPPRRLASRYAPSPPSRGRIVEHVGDDEEEEELEGVYSDDEVEDDEYSDDEPPEEYVSPHDRDVADFLTFGNSLQVKGGILTVADDLLKNDGKRFIEMMEQLAERRMAREEDAREHFPRSYGHPNGSYSAPHDHPPPDDDEYEDEEDEEEDYEDSQDEEYEDEEDPMTEEQRMEEGRRMFQIFAARMFEQRVLSAYKEKVAKERQNKLLEELEEESRQVDEQKAKKAKNAQKKKDKAAQKKQALAEEKARKEAEKASEEAARLEAEQKRVTEQKQRAEEKRKQKEAQRKAEEEARLKKEADRQRRIHEQREKQAEQERKAREAKEREKKQREEQRVKEKDAREQKEREAQERKEKQERDKREKEARAAKAQREAQDAKDAKDKSKDDKSSQRQGLQGAPSQPQFHPPTGPSRRSQQQQPAVPVPTVLPQHSSNPANYASPKIPVATPAIPKAPTPIRPRTASQQDNGPSSSSGSQSASMASPNPSPKPSIPTALASVTNGQQRKSSGSIPGPFSTQPSHSASPLSDQAAKPYGQSTPLQGPPVGMHIPPGLNHHQPPPGFGNRMSNDGVFPPGFRPSPNAMMPPPGMGAPPGRGFPPMSVPPPGFPQGSNDAFSMPQGYPIPKDVPPPGHARQGSNGAFEGVSPPATQPIGRPAPIGRPGSRAQGRAQDADEDTKHLGSSVLVDDDEPPLAPDVNTGSMRGQPPGLRGAFAPSPFIETGFPMAHNPWGPPNVSAGSHAFPPPGFGGPGWGAPAAPPGFTVGSPHSMMSARRTSSQPRHVAVRLMLCQACKDLANSGTVDTDGFVNLSAIQSHIDSHAGDPSITELDLLNLCDTEGSPSNGGGTFDVKRDVGGTGRNMIRWVPDASDGINPQFRAVGAPGEIGSPLTAQASLRGN